MTVLDRLFLLYVNSLIIQAEVKQASSCYKIIAISITFFMSFLGTFVTVVE